MSLKDFLFDRRVWFVQRWHARQTRISESLAEHQYFVARDALAIAQLVQLRLNYPLDLERVMALALYHDETEKEIGDVSGYAKREYPELKAKLGEIEAGIVDKVLFNNMPFELQPYYKDLMAEVAEHKTTEAQIVKLADKVSAYMFAWYEVNTGNFLMQEILDQLELELASLDWPWLNEMRRTMGARGEEWLP
jgi:5'-deoxynucleotidase